MAVRLMKASVLYLLRDFCEQGTESGEFLATNVCFTESAFRVDMVSEYSRWQFMLFYPSCCRDILHSMESGS